VAGVFLLSRHFLVGNQWADVLLSYKLDTYEVLVLLLLVLTLPRRSTPAAAAGAGYRVLAIRVKRKHRAPAHTVPVGDAVAH
jgi:hypothetical protein